MRKIFLLICVGLSLGVTAQDFQADECNVRTQRNTSFTKTAVFNMAGINLSKYKWDNSSINCHINSTMLYAKKSGNKKIGGIVGASVGGAFLVGGASILAQTGGGGGAAMTALGSAGICGSIPLFIFSKKDKRQMNYHLDHVSQYYQYKNLF